MDKPRALTKLRDECERFNQQFPVGTAVRVWTGQMNDGPGRPAVVREPAYVLGNHTAVARFDGISGCVAVSHVGPA